MAEEIEKVRLDKISLNELLNQNFIAKISELKEEIFPSAIILIKTRDKISIPLIMSHQNKKEVEEKIIHIESPDSDFLNKIKEKMQKL